MRIKGRTNNKPINWNSIPNLYDILNDMYNNQKLSLNEIAKKLSVAPTTLKNKMLELGFIIRDRSESFNLKMKEMYNNE